MIKIVQPLNNNVVMGYDRKKAKLLLSEQALGFGQKKVIRLMKVKFKNVYYRRK